MYNSRFWKKNWDEGLEDLDPSIWETTFPDALRRTFGELPNKMAFSFMGIEVSFKELDLYSNQFAHMLIGNGFKKGDVVAVNLPNIPEYMIAYVGTMKAGCILSGVSPLLSEEEMKYQLNDLGAKGKKLCLVTLDAVFQHRLSKIADQIPSVKLIVYTNVGNFLPKIKQVLGKLLKKIPSGKVHTIKNKKVINFNDILTQESNDEPSVQVTPDDIAYIQYTGGTTGPPKGAVLTQRNIMADLIIVQTWLGLERGRGLAVSGFPFFHIAGLFFCENCLFLGWSQILIVDPRNIKMIVGAIAKYKPTFLVNVPSLYQLLLKNPKFKKLDHSNVEVCISSASPFPVESQQELESIVGKEKLVEVYGMTECSPLSVMNPMKNKKKLGHVGLPLLNTEIKLINPDNGKEVPIGEAGEICVCGPMVMQGYYNKPEETSNAIDADGFMHTGDVAIMDEEGYLRIVDRTKDMIIVSGFKVFSSKIEDVLSKHPSIDMIALIGVPNPERPGSELVKAYIQTIPGSHNGLDALKKNIISYARDHCAPYEVPKQIEFINEMPLTSVGKVDKKVLRARARGA